MPTRARSRCRGNLQQSARVWYQPHNVCFQDGHAWDSGFRAFGDAWEDAVVGLGVVAEVDEESPCPSPVPAAQTRAFGLLHWWLGCGHVL